VRLLISMMISKLLNPESPKVIIHSRWEKTFASKPLQTACIVPVPSTTNLLRKMSVTYLSASLLLTSKGGYTLVTLPHITTPYRDSVDGTRDHVTYQKLVMR
jgi:hypothetical protein